MMDSNGRPQLLFIDKGGKKINVGSKFSDFNIEKKLGSGNFGSVYLVSSKITKKLYAMKEIKISRYKNEDECKEVEKEIKLLENLHHPHVITYFTSFRENENFYIVTEYINGGNLLNLLEKNVTQGKKIDEKIIWDLLVQSLSGLLYLHENKKIIHRDIKPDNLLIDFEGNLKISDFGVSAIDSEDVDTLVKCHNTIKGPIQFMAPEVALGMKYDFKSDIYMLGLTFFVLMSNKMPEKKIDFGPILIPVKDKEAKLPDIYSESLKNFIQKLLLDNPNQRPSAKRAYSEAITSYSFKYLKVTSICSTLLCLSSIPSFESYFKSDRVKTYIENDMNNNNERKYLVTKSFKDAFINCSVSNFIQEVAKIECLKLRIIMYANKERMASSPEIHLYDFVPNLLNKIHNELNKYVDKSNNPGANNINNEDDEACGTVVQPNEEKIDFTNEKEVINAIIKKFSEKCRSKISDKFFYLNKIVHECPDCQRNIKFASNIIVTCGMYPERAAIYLNKNDLNIIDLFKHYRKKRYFLDLNENCPYCGNVKKDVNITKIFYTSPLNLILDIAYKKDDKFNLTIEEFIDIQEFVERKDISKCNYKLIGAIFTETKENEGRKYVSISRTQNGGWKYFNGSSLQDSSFNELANHKQVKMLFYSSE